ncbi:MAG: M3 family oligoendopeptidase [Anaerolineaceae bacterium]|nr:M3 family oligoendopeptidase [Anaerolineaceae bacterium]
MTELTPPRWDLTNVYPALEAPALSADLESIRAKINALESSLGALPAQPDKEEDALLAEKLSILIEQVNTLLEQSGKVRAYIYSFVSTDSYNNVALRLLSEFEQVGMRIEQQLTFAQSWVGKLSSRLDAVVARGGLPASHAFFLRETAEQSKYLMAPELEALAAELNLSGGNAWSKLQGQTTSQMTVDFELDGQVRTLPMPALINLHSHPEEEVRRRAYEAELKAWKTVEGTLCAAMNGVKGEAITLNRRRGRSDALHAPIDDARIDRQTLEAMLGAMQDSFPMFRRYFKAKAARLGKEKLPWWDVFAPSGKLDAHYTFPQARAFIVDNFANFSPDLAAFADQAFENRWIDAEQRPGKRGGAFCMSVPVVNESRVLCNFDGTLDQVSTIAHELGHAFHNDCMFKAGKTALQRNTPMTMAETASIMCETIAFEAVLAQAKNPQEELAILETSLVGDAQVIVDIYSRYLFEKEVFEKREKAELNPAELCDIMSRAQQETYGDGVDENYLHPYMWTWKPHYYSAGLSFYNFPYAFGLLFGIGLYAIYQQRGAAFVPDYKNLLASTGEGTAADLAMRFGIDIRSRAFWEGSLQVIGKRIDRYVRL